MGFNSGLKGLMQYCCPFCTDFSQILCPVLQLLLTFVRISYALIARCLYLLSYPPYVQPYYTSSGIKIMTVCFVYIFSFILSSFLLASKYLLTLNSVFIQILFSLLQVGKTKWAGFKIGCEHKYCTEVNDSQLILIFFPLFYLLFTLDVLMQFK